MKVVKGVYVRRLLIYECANPPSLLDYVRCRLGENVIDARVININSDPKQRDAAH